MSHAYYNEVWLVTRSDLEKLLEFDRDLQKSKPIKNRENALDRALNLYIRYRYLVRRLVICYNQMVQTQKRELIKKVVDCAIGRMLQCKREVVKLDSSYFQWPDDVLYKLKLTPDDVNTPGLTIDKNHALERKELIEKIKREEEEKCTFQNEKLKMYHTLYYVSAFMIRERSLSQVMISSMMELEESPSKIQLMRRRRHRPTDTAQMKVLIETPEQRQTSEARKAREAAEKVMHDAVLLIQSHERARVGRCIGKEALLIYEYKRKLETGDTAPPMKFDKATYIKAIVIIQRAWRTFAARKDFKRKLNRLEEILDMTIPSWKSLDIYQRDEEIFQKRLQIIPTYAARTEKMFHDERIRLLKMVGPGLIEDITDEIQEWFIVWYDTVGHFDVYPPEELGGSVLIVTGQTTDPEEYLMQQIQKQKDAKTKKIAQPEKAKIKPKVKEIARGWFMPETPAFTCLEEANNEFIENWSYRDESCNPLQRPYLDLIADKLCYELQLEMRLIVDELMRLELEKLNEALLKDHAADRPKFQIPRMLGAQRLPRKKSKKKSKKDRLADISIEELFKELVQENIIRNYPERSLNNWFGDLAYQNYEAYSEFRDHYHRLGEIKQIIMEYCVLPLSSKEIHTIAPLIRSVCICGLPGYGKTFLVDAICSEVGALLFDLTPSVLIGKYIGKKNERRLMDIIGKLSRIYAPSVIFIDGSEKPWLKKVPLVERYLQPKRFAKHHAKFVKSIRPGDQVLFLTVSSEPYKAKGAFTKIHNVFIMIPLTDYNTLYMYYKYMLMKYHGIDRNIDVSCLAKMSVGVPLKFIQKSIEKVLSLERRIILNYEPLSQVEIMEEVWKYEPLANKILEQYKHFENKTPLGRMRERTVAKEKEAYERSAALKAMREKRRT
ncbi:PREDICTED: IQ and AAA domain-containing protein 1-like [Polistes dominula]|uniref:IQ and AAA domain-containing protein 1-like n=1 Tax=Polistes dominula TaxID=743375 RepID=A0ABM1IH49_POLDO|nr:PREDICTED: IQ and AAA domain-containing protein 1-like [Polistes dominula]